MKILDRILSLISVVLFVAAVISGLILLLYTATLHRVQDLSGEGAFAVGKVQSVEDAFFIFDAKKLNVSFEADGYYNDTTVKLMTKDKTIQPGDEVELYYNTRVPESAMNEETLAIYHSSLLTIVYIAGGALVLMILIQCLIWLIRNGKSRSHKRTRQKEASQRKYNRYMKKDPEFWMERYNAMKNRSEAYLMTSLKRRKRLVTLAGDKRHLYCAAYYDLMILYFGSCCDGVNACECGRESLKYPKEFKKLSDDLEAGLGYNMYYKSMVVTATLTDNREEAKELCNEVIKNSKDKEQIKVAKDLLSLMEKFPRWSEFQRNNALNYYSRTNPELDKGAYSEGCAILMTILSREGQPGYDLSEEEYVSILDDWLMLGLKQFATLRTTGYNSFLNRRYIPNEQLIFLVKKPLEVLLEFLPDCQEKRFREIFKSDLKEYEMLADVFKGCLPEYEKARKELGM